MFQHIPILGKYPREMKTFSQKDLYMNVHSSIIDNSQNVENNPNVPQH